MTMTHLIIFLFGCIVGALSVGIVLLCMMSKIKEKHFQELLKLRTPRLHRD